MTRRLGLNREATWILHHAGDPLAGLIMEFMHHLCSIPWWVGRIVVVTVVPYAAGSRIMR